MLHDRRTNTTVCKAACCKRDQSGSGCSTGFIRDGHQVEDFYVSIFPSFTVFCLFFFAVRE